MAIRHIDTGEYIKAQQERITRLQAELQRRSEMSGAESATDEEIAQAIVKAYPGRLGGIATEILAHLTAMRTRARRCPTFSDVIDGKDFIVEA